jgi:hypothetical protein
MDQRSIVLGLARDGLAAVAIYEDLGATLGRSRLAILQ